MWEHFFTHENTVPHLYNTGILIIHTNYPHPHAAVSIILLLFLLLLLHNVFSQTSSDDNFTNYWWSILIFVECPGLAALLSLASVVMKQRQSAFTIQRPLLSPALPTLQHVLFNLVNLASIVLEHLQVQPQVKISLFILCFKLPPRRTCQKAITIVSNVF